MSGAAKSAPALRAGAWLIPLPGGPLPLPSAAKSAVTPLCGRANGWVVFPRMGRAGGNGVASGGQEPAHRFAGEPINRRKTKGYVCSQGWLGSGHIHPVFYRVFKGCTKCMPIMKSGTIHCHSPKYRRSPSGVLHGSSICPCPKRVDQGVNLLPSLFSPGVVYLACKDSTKCKAYAFGQQSAAV